MLPTRPFRRLLLWAVAFEASLGIIGWGAAIASGVPFSAQLNFAPKIFFWSFAETVPLVAVLWFLVRSDWDFSQDLIKTVQQTLSDLFSGIGLPGIVVLSLAAGIGEEALFRGFLQPFIGRHTDVWVSIVITGALFGAVHWISTPYAIMAAIVGIYLGILAELHGTIIAPMTVHALYDMVAIWFLLQVKDARSENLPETETGDTFSSTPAGNP